ncbi:hypothetical protein T265_15184, partial [Opisthorchis viverrini]
KHEGCPSLDRGSRDAEVGFKPRTFRSVNTRSNHFYCFGLGLDNLAVSQPSGLLRVAWRLGDKRVLQLYDRYCNTVKICTKVGILSDCPRLDRGSREAEVGFEPQTLRSVNSRCNHFDHLAPGVINSEMDSWINSCLPEGKPESSHQLLISDCFATRIPCAKLGEFAYPTAQNVGLNVSHSILSTINTPVTADEIQLEMADY